MHESNVYLVRNLISGFGQYYRMTQQQVGSFAIDANLSLTRLSVKAAEKLIPYVIEDIRPVSGRVGRHAA